MSAVLMPRQRSRSDSRRTTAALVRRLTALILIAFYLNCYSLNPLRAAGDRPVKIVVLGDSLSSGFGLLFSLALPERLEQVLREKGYAVTIVNAGVAGDTVSDGLRRLDSSVPEGAEAVIIELGPNDAERGVDPNVTQAGLASLLEWFKQRQIQVLLTGMRASPSMGAAYVRAFGAIYPALASTYSFVWYPYILDGVAGDPKLLQFDGEHPNAEGVNVIVTRILPKVEELIGRVRAAREP
jgi:acyl-CoA thioesterase I